MKIADTSNQDVVLDNKKPQKKRAIIAVAAVAVIAAGIWVISPAVSRWSQAETSIPLSRVRIDTLSRDSFTRDVSVQGKVVAAVSPTIYSPADGTITFEVDAGTQVRQGQPLAKIDSPELTSRLQQELATLESMQTGFNRQAIQAKKQQLADKKAEDLARVTLTTAEREKRRADMGFEKSAISQIDYEKAQDDLANARLQYQHAVADAKLNKESLDFDSQTLALGLDRQGLAVAELQRQVDALAVISPVDGIVGNLAIENKTRLSKNQAILSVVDLTQFEVEIAIPESYADDLAIGMDVEVNFAQQLFSARLVTISPEILNNQVTGRVRFEQHSPPGLRQNQRLNTRILLEQREDVLQVQRGQFLDSSNGRFAYKVHDGLATKIRIRVGARSLSRVEILEGLTEGDRIIISGTDSFNNAEQILLTQ